ncbi:MAG: M23 family metallopeptidase [Actinomycetota bacterium]|nr:M23 family metallopeptidase [Actinomycetota bacterium]
MSVLAAAAILASGGARAHASPATAPPWNPAAGQRSGCATVVAGQCDEHDYTSGDPREWGIDIPLAAGTTVYAPEPATIIGYQPSSTDWQPGRLLLRLNRGGAVIGFGHVNASLRSGPVNTNQPIATIGDQGGNSHVEFMYSPSGGLSRSAFTSYPKSDPGSPFSLLTTYFNSPPPPPPVTPATRDTVLRSDGHSGYTLDGFGDVMAFGGAPSVPANQEPQWPGWNIARRLVLATDNSGYVLDGFGGVHPFWAAGATAPPSPAGGAYWPNWDIARDIELLPDRSGGYTLDGFGGVHPFALGANPLPPATAGAPYWANWDIARALAVNPAGTGGYVLDGFGGVHPFAIGSNPQPPAATSEAYWANWDIARDLIVSFNGTSGYTLDGFGGVHPFAAGSPAPPPVTMARYTPNSDLATGLALSNQQGAVSGQVSFSDQAGPTSFGPGVRIRKVAVLPGSATAGYTLAGDGTITAFGGAPPVTGAPAWPDWDIARDLALLASGKGGYVLDGFGGIHPFGIGTNPAPAATNNGAYWPNWDIARSIVLTTKSTGGYVLDGFGGIHPFGIGTNRTPAPLDSAGAYWSGYDVAASVALAGRGAVTVDSYGGVHFTR